MTTIGASSAAATASSRPRLIVLIGPTGRPGEDRIDGCSTADPDRRRHEQVRHLEQALVDDDPPGVTECEDDVADQQTRRAAEQQREGRRPLSRREREPGRQHEEAHRDRRVDRDRDPGHHPRVVEAERGQDQQLVDEQQRPGAEHDAVEPCAGLVRCPSARAAGRTAPGRTGRSREGRRDPGATTGGGEVTGCFGGPRGRPRRPSTAGRSRRSPTTANARLGRCCRRPMQAQTMPPTITSGIGDVSPTRRARGRR